MIRPQTLILATRNQGKVRELREPLARFGFDVRSLPEDFPEVAETGSTFEENALIKARAVAEALLGPAVADDSGIEVDALDGAPGVYSARYSRDWPEVEGESTDERNNRKLLAELEGVPAERRTARFRCFFVAGQTGRHCGERCVGGQHCAKAFRRQRLRVRPAFYRSCKRAHGRGAFARGENGQKSQRKGSQEAA